MTCQPRYLSRCSCRIFYGALFAALLLHSTAVWGEEGATAPNAGMDKDGADEPAEYRAPGFHFGIGFHFQFGFGDHLMEAPFLYPEFEVRWERERITWELASMAPFAAIDVLLLGDLLDSSDPPLWEALNSSSRHSSYVTIMYSDTAWRLFDAHDGAGATMGVEGAWRLVERDFEEERFRQTVPSAGLNAGFQWLQPDHNWAAKVGAGTARNEESLLNPYVGARLQGQKMSSTSGRTVYARANLDLIRVEIDDETCIDRPRISCQEYLYAESVDWMWLAGIMVGTTFRR